MFALEEGLKLSNKSADTNALLNALFAQLEARRVVRRAAQRARSRCAVRGRGGALKHPCAARRVRPQRRPRGALACARNVPLRRPYGARRRRTSPRLASRTMTRCTWRASR
jgi:hypothetical protein